MPHKLTSYFLSGDILRSRSASEVVLFDNVDIPAPPARLLADWQREIETRLDLEAGDVEVMPLARARMRWPDYSRCVQAVAEWTQSLGLPGILASSDVALMVCRGARYHHDGAQYGGSAFCNLFLSEDKGLDVHFSFTGHRVPLRRGTVMIFDTAQPHGVVQRGSNGFNAAEFPANRDLVQLFLTWELPIENADVARALKIDFEVDFEVASSESLRMNEEQVLLNGEQVVVCPESGDWRRTD